MSTPSQTLHTPPSPPSFAMGQLLLSGGMTPAQYLGLSQERLYKLATLGHDMLVRGKTQSAIDIFKGLVAASPYDSVFHCHLASAYAQVGRFPEALAAYTRALELNIANVDALAGRGELLLREDKVAEALMDIKTALQLDPEARRDTTQRARATLMVLRTMADATDPSTP